MTGEYFLDQMPEDFRPEFIEHAAPQAIQAQIQIWTKKKDEAEKVLLWLRELQAHRATQVMRGEWPARKEGKNVSKEALLAELNEKAEGDLYGYLTEEKVVYSEPRGWHRWWNTVFKVVKIDDKLVGFVDGETTGDESAEEKGWTFSPASVCEVEPYEVTVTKYREKTYSSPAGAVPAPA